MHACVVAGVRVSPHAANCTKAQQKSLLWVAAGNVAICFRFALGLFCCRLAAIYDIVSPQLALAEALYSMIYLILALATLPSSLLPIRLARDPPLDDSIPMRFQRPSIADV
jgi:hypothetical protein